MVCSATVVQDPANPGKSNLVWTAGHCVHAGKKGGWYRNIAFVPSYNDAGRSATELRERHQGGGRSVRRLVGRLGADLGPVDRAGRRDGRRRRPVRLRGHPCDAGEGRQRQVAGGDGRFGAAGGLQRSRRAEDRRASRRPATRPAPPYDGQTLYQCADKPGRLSIDGHDPTMYRIGCTMTGGSSGGGWVATGSDGKPALVSNTSIGPVTAGWLAGPRLGEEAKGVYDAVSKKFAGRVSGAARPTRAAAHPGPGGACAAHPVRADRPRTRGCRGLTSEARDSPSTAFVHVQRGSQQPCVPHVRPSARARTAPRRSRRHRPRRGPGAHRHRLRRLRRGQAPASPPPPPHGPSTAAATEAGIPAGPRRQAQGARDRRRQVEGRRLEELGQGQVAQ